MMTVPRLPSGSTLPRSVLSGACSRPASAVAWAVLLVTASGLFGCASHEEPEGAADERAASRANWTLILTLDGETHEASLESMDIFLQDDEESAEPFALAGDGVRLAGSIPGAIHVGYEEDFDRLIGHRVAILASGFDGSGDFDSSIELEDGPLAVEGGWMEIRSVTGTREGSEGDRTLHGTIELRTDRGLLHGKIDVHAITWG